MKSLDVSVVLRFRDHEHLVGRASRRIAEYFSALGHSFEIIAVDEGSGDNSHAVLALLRQELGCLEVVVGKGYGAGAAKSQGRVMILVDLETISEELSPSLTKALSQVWSGEIDLTLVAEHLLVCNRGQSGELIARGLAKRSSERVLLQQAQASGLVTHSYCPEPRTGSGLSRVLGALMPRSGDISRA